MSYLSKFRKMVVVMYSKFIVVLFKTEYSFTVHVNKDFFTVSFEWESKYIDCFKGYDNIVGVELNFKNRYFSAYCHIKNKIYSFTFPQNNEE